jgi:hypothetical protein
MYFGAREGTARSEAMDGCWDWGEGGGAPQTAWVEKEKYRKTPVKTTRHVCHKGPFWLHIQKPTENQRKLNGFGLTDSIAVLPTPMSVRDA